LAGETEVLGENLPQRRTTFVHHKIPHNQTRVWTRAATVGSRRLSPWLLFVSLLQSYSWEIKYIEN
jgi:hypothetical protein